MKINISGLMGIIAEEEKRFNSLSASLRNEIYNISIQELNGTVNIIEDYKEEFDKDLSEFRESLGKISKLKTILYEKNNSFKLSDGRTIQTAIIDNINLRKMKDIYELILSCKSSKRRVTEVNNSYFECKEVNFNVDEIKLELQEINVKIQQTDFEISKLNSVEFEINI